MNILVTGANGQLGRGMRLVAGSSTDNYVFTDVVEVEGLETVRLDITSMDEVRAAVARYAVDVIVNCAAYTNVEAAEDNYDLAELLNARAPENLAVAIKEVGGLLVHISTDYVFGGESYSEPCREDMKGAPTGVYGLTKLHGEEAVKASGCSYVILRTSWLYSEFGKNFVKTMLSLTSTRPAVQVVSDQIGTPTYALDLAKAIAVIFDDYRQERLNYAQVPLDCRHGNSSTDNLVSRCSAPQSHIAQGQVPEHDDCRGTDCISQIADAQSQLMDNSNCCCGVMYSKSGVYHYSNEGSCSWFDFASVIAELAGHTSCRITPCLSSEFPSRVTRPAYSVLDKTLVKRTFGLSIPSWPDSLKSCLSNLLPPVEG